ncbi:hypothetical protein TrRE_jg223, partial [Triparma retinervis]
MQGLEESQDPSPDFLKKQFSDYPNHFKLMSSSLTIEEFKTLIQPLQQNGWVELVSDSALLTDLSSEDCNLLQLSLDLIQSCPLSVAEALAKAADVTGREAIDLAVPEIKKALQSRLLFLGRYELYKDHAIHKSATCVVMKAYDEHAEE